MKNSLKDMANILTALIALMGNTVYRKRVLKGIVFEKILHCRGG